MSDELGLFGADQVSSNSEFWGVRRQGAHVNSASVSAAISGEGGV